MSNSEARHKVLGARVRSLEQALKMVVTFLACPGNDCLVAHPSPKQLMVRWLEVARVGKVRLPGWDPRDGWRH